MTKDLIFLSVIILMELIFFILLLISIRHNKWQKQNPKPILLFEEKNILNLTTYNFLRSGDYKYFNFLPFILFLFCFNSFLLIIFVVGLII